MKDLTLWNPKSLFSDKFERLFDGFFDTRFGMDPRVDIEENEENVLVKVELPGMARDEITIDLKDNILTISGEKKSERTKEGTKFHRTEIAYGCFSRAFQIPYAIDQEKIQAKFTDGLLQITLPKTEVEKPKQITID